MKTNHKWNSSIRISFFLPQLYTIIRFRRLRIDRIAFKILRSNINSNPKILCQKLFHRYIMMHAGFLEVNFICLSKLKPPSKEAWLLKNISWFLWEALEDGMDWAETKPKELNSHLYSHSWSYLWVQLPTYNPLFLPFDRKKIQICIFFRNCRKEIFRVSWNCIFFNGGSWISQKNTSHIRPYH